jgi:hypothetical protein
MLLKKWGNGCEYKIQSGTRGGQKLSFLTGARLLRWMEICRKVRCAIHISSYPTGMFKELHDKLVTKKLCYTPFWATRLSILPICPPTCLNNDLAEQSRSLVNKDGMKLKNHMEYSLIYASSPDQLAETYAFFRNCQTFSKSRRSLSCSENPAI